MIAKMAYNFGECQPEAFFARRTVNKCTLRAPERSHHLYREKILSVHAPDDSGANRRASSGRVVFGELRTSGERAEQEGRVVCRATF